jgi:two-component system chemotaxis sensor kinase CheA
MPMELQFDADQQEIELFLSETNDHIQLLDQHIILLETHPNDEELLQRIFRSAHTIKGGAGMIGHQRMAELSHDMENVLDALRSHTVQATQRTIDALLEALDALRVLNNEVVTRVPADLPMDDLRHALAACLKPAAVRSTDTKRPGAESDWPYDPALDALPEGADRDRLSLVAVSVDIDCGLSVARSFQAAMELEHAATVLRMIPSKEQMERFERCIGFKALACLHGSDSDLRTALEGITDVTAVAVEPFTAPERQDVEQEPAPGETLRAAANGQPGASLDTSIRISVSIVDDLMSLVSELVLGRTRLQTLKSQLQSRYTEDESVAGLEDTVSHLDQVVTDLQSTVMKARMLPVGNVFHKFPRLVRDLTSHSGKQVRFTMSGNETELDRSVIEQLSDPLVHLLRNALDHGVESPEQREAAGKDPVGTITLSATPAENHILIEVGDDGAGIDGARVAAKAVEKGLISNEAAGRLTEQEAVELVFLPGLSTARAVTDISGRGVGMDIVKATVDRMGGHVAIQSTLGKGSTFSITLPLTLAIMQALLVSVDEAVYALPLNMVTEILSVPDGQVHTLQGTEATLVRGTILPLLRLRQYFQCKPETEPRGAQHVVATRVDGQTLGLVVDQVIGEQEIVMKPLGSYMGYIRGLAGATILGDGRIGLLIDVPVLRNWTPDELVA